jgi:hypothetical protein
MVGTIEEDGRPGHRHLSAPRQRKVHPGHASSRQSSWPQGSGQGERHPCPLRLADDQLQLSRESPTGSPGTISRLTVTPPANVTPCVRAASRPDIEKQTNSTRERTHGLQGAACRPYPWTCHPWPSTSCPPPGPPPPLWARPLRIRSVLLPPPAVLVVVMPPAMMMVVIPPSVSCRGRRSSAQSDARQAKSGNCRQNCLPERHDSSPRVFLVQQYQPLSCNRRVSRA